MRKELIEMVDAISDLGLRDEMLDDLLFNWLSNDDAKEFIEDFSRLRDIDLGGNV